MSSAPPRSTVPMDTVPSRAVPECPPAADRLPCMEVSGGNGATHQQVATTGLDVTIFSEPHESDPYGGDVYYLSSCASGRITRIVVADVAGHGHSVADRARQLRRFARENVNHIRHRRMVKRTNAAFTDETGDGGFATALFATYFQPTRALRLCNAGHPPPLLYRASTGEWTSLVDPSVRNLPLGVMADSSFEEQAIRLEPGDAVLVVTDGILESRDASGEMLGSDGLLEWARVNGAPSRDTVGQLAELVFERSGSEPDDDITALLIRPNDRKVGLKDNLLSPVRYLAGLCRGNGED